MKFDDVTKALVYRAIQSDKNKQDITAAATSTQGLKEGSKKKKLERNKSKAVVDILLRNKNK